MPNRPDDLVGLVRPAMCLTKFAEALVEPVHRALDAVR